MIRKLFLNDKFILGLILLNSIVLFIGGYYPKGADRIIISALDNLITALFVIELFIKFKTFGIKNYFNNGWNIFDFTLVLLSVPTLVTFIFDIQIIDFSFLLIFRISRVFKVFRFIKFIPNVQHLITGIQRALKASIFVFLGFGIYIFIIGILSFYLFNNSGSEYFSNPMISLYSTFKIFTVEGWFEIPEQIIIGYSSTEAFFTYLYFIFVVLTGGVFGLSIVNSIFVDAMVSDNNDKIEEKIDKLDSKITELLKNTRQHETRQDS